MSLTTVLLLLVLVRPIAAQIPGVESAKTSPSQTKAADPLGRSTPRGTITGFTRAVHRDDFVTAARYMQTSGAQSAAAPSLARDLNDLMDRYFEQPIMSISNSADGALDDGLPIDRERVGPLTVGDEKVDVALVRVDDPQSGPIWLISSATLAQVPALHQSISETLVDRIMPRKLVRRSLFGISLAQWIFLAASIAIPLALLWLLSGALVALMRRTIDDPRRRQVLESSYAEVRWPSIIVLTLAIHFAVTPFLGLPLSFRFRYTRLALLAAVIAVAWLCRRLLTVAFERARSMVHGSNQTGTRSLMMLGERLAKVVVVVVAILAILTIAGVDTKTALAGFGIGGVAIALGAQKTVENVLGGIFLLSDRALAVGDTCTIADRKGVVEDITLRSVRLRTDEQTLVSIPAGSLSQSSVENFASRGKTLVQTRLHLRYGTTAEQLGSILEGVGSLIAENPKLETATSRVRLVDFSDRAIELELFAYVLTADGADFLLVRQDLLLRIAAIVESSGSGFAQPTQFVYMDREVDVERPSRDAVAHDDVRLAQSSVG